MPTHSAVGDFEPKIGNGKYNSYKGHSNLEKLVKNIKTMAIVALF